MENLKSGIIYYSNLLITKFQQHKIIKYDKHTYSDYFNTPRKYAGKTTLLVNEANTMIARVIREGKPMMVARFGSVELYNMEVFDLKYTPKYEIAINTLTNNAGFFPNKRDLILKFVDIMHESCTQVDFLAFWNMFREEYYIQTALPKEAKLMQLRYLEPWFSSSPWTAALENKKVLVIHPFEKTIREQYTKRELLFNNPQVLPKFELKTIKAVQTMASQKDSRFSSWFDALDWMYNEAMKMDFDIALIGCGAYGFPLAAKLKQSGKQAIHMGGVLQILFGIKGRRWDDDPVVSKLYNEYWVRPDASERPNGMQAIEGGCYW